MPVEIFESLNIFKEYGFKQFKFRYIIRKFKMKKNEKITIKRLDYWDASLEIMYLVVLGITVPKNRIG